jgi:hypothetical protein
VSHFTFKTIDSLVKEGTLPAICTFIGRVGRCTREFIDKAGIVQHRDQDEVVFNFQFVTLAGQPSLLASYTNSLDPRASLAKMLTAWSGRPVPRDTSTSSFLGKPALVSVQHKVSNTGRPFAAIGGIIALPDSWTVGAPEMEPFAFDVEKDDIPEAIDKLPYLFGQSLRKRIEESKEYKARAAAAAGNQAPAVASPAPAADADEPF